MLHKYILQNFILETKIKYDNIKEKYFATDIIVFTKITLISFKTHITSDYLNIMFNCTVFVTKTLIHILRQSTEY